MPIFEFLCDDCGKVTEEIFKSENDRPDACVFCGSKKIEKLVSASAFHLKGSGWYKSDYGSKTVPTTKKSADKTEQVDKTEKKETPKSLKTTGGCGGGCSCH